MSTRFPLLGLLFALAGLGMFAGPGNCQSKGALEIARLTECLQEVIETKEFTNPMTLKDATQLLYEKFAAKGNEFPIVVNVDAFSRHGDSDDPSPNEAQVQLPVLPKQMSVQVALRILLSQVHAKSTFIIRQGHIEIVPQWCSTTKALLQERVLVRFDKVALSEVLDELSVFTGAPIILDARTKEKGQERVSMFLNHLSLEDSLTVLTEQAGLRFVTLETGIFVTLPAEARASRSGRNSVNSNAR